MQISVVHGEALRQNTPLLALSTWEDETLPREVAVLLEDGDWTGTFKQTLALYPRGALPARRLLLVGLGKRAQISSDRLREAAAIVAQQARALKVAHYMFNLPTAEGLNLIDSAQALAEGALLGLYRFLEYKTGPGTDDQHEIAEMTIVTAIEDDTIRRGATLGAVVGRGVAFARDLSNRPSNDLTPAQLAESAQALGTRFGMSVSILGPEELREQGFGGLLGVAQGSAHPPRFIIIEHGAALADTPTVCLVGKGITFDTGGISLKAAERMEDMKMDMGGAAAVLGAMQVVGELNLPLHVISLISAAENMPSGTAYKPGDILKTLSGKTVEVLNTDAEGRIVLADALFYAQRYHPHGIIDLATLTGAILVALGAFAIGVMGNDEALEERIVRAGLASGEPAWRLPLWEPYKELVKSDIADVKNSAGRHAGAITAGAFLSNFVGEYPWAHLDIAGAALLDQKKAYIPKGANGAGVRLLVQMLRTWAEEH